MGYKIFLTLGMFLCWIISNAQVQMADDFRGEGKIYVVIAVVLVVLLGFFVVLFRLDRKAKSLEKEIEENEN